LADTGYGEGEALIATEEPLPFGETTTVASSLPLLTVKLAL
jgi:hypothetical protein